MFPHPVFAESLMIHPTEWYELIAVRFEVLGCDGKYKYCNLCDDTKSSSPVFAESIRANPKEKN